MTISTERYNQLRDEFLKIASRTRFSPVDDANLDDMWFANKSLDTWLQIISILEGKYKELSDILEEVGKLTLKNRQLESKLCRTRALLMKTIDFVNEEQHER